MKKAESSPDREAIRELKLLPLRVALDMHKQGLLGELELQCVSAVTAESLGNKVIPDDR